MYVQLTCQNSPDTPVYVQLTCGTSPDTPLYVQLTCLTSPDTPVYVQLTCQKSSPDTCVAVYVQLTCLTYLVSFYDKPWELSNYSKLDPHIVIFVSPDKAFSFSPLFIIDRHCPTQECQMMLFLDLLVLWYGSRQYYY